MKTKIFFIYSGKGGVGKSTITFYLAYALNKLNKTVGVVDLDMKAPSLYHLFSNIGDISLPYLDPESFKIYPAISKNVLIQSTGFINNNRGVLFGDDLLEGAFYQFFHPVFDSVDFLLIDLPPGIDQIHNLINKKFSQGKYILLSTFSLLSLEDCLKSYNYLNSINARIECIVYNMSFIQCNTCKEKQYLFDPQNLNNYSDLKKYKQVVFPFSEEISAFSNTSIVPQNTFFQNSLQGLVRIVLNES